MQVSFVIPLFNNLALTRACVESLQATVPTGLAHEIILADDGSSDGTRDWLTTLRPPFRVVLNERNLGYAATNNRAVAIASGQLLSLLNNDLILLPGWFEPLAAAHRQLGHRAGLVGNIQVDARTGAIDHTGIVINRQCKPVHDRALPAGWAQFFSAVRRVPAVTGACVILERALWLRLGGFDEGYINGGEDVDLCFRARAVGRVNAVALKSIVRHHISSSIGRKARDEQNSFRLARRWPRELCEAATGPLLDWCRAYHEYALAEPRDADAAVARRAWAYVLGVTHTPPPAAIDAMRDALNGEFARWEQMFR